LKGKQQSLELSKKLIINRRTKAD